MHIKHTGRGWAQQCVPDVFDERRKLCAATCGAALSGVSDRSVKLNSLCGRKTRRLANADFWAVNHAESWPARR